MRSGLRNVKPSATAPPSELPTKIALLRQVVEEGLLDRQQEIQCVVDILWLRRFTVTPLVKNDATVSALLEGRDVVFEVAPAAGTWTTAVNKDGRAALCGGGRVVRVVNRSARTHLVKLRCFRISRH